MFLNFCIFLTIMTISAAHYHYSDSRFHRNHFQPHHKHAFYSAGPFPHPLNHFFTGTTYQPKMNNRHQSHESLSTYQCDFILEDFTEETPSRRTVVCTWGNEFILRRHNRRQFWCIGYLPSSSDSPQMRNRRNKPKLTLKFDRAFRMGYSPSGIVMKNSHHDLQETLYLDPSDLNTIIIRGSYNGMPEIEMIEFRGERICEEFDEDFSSEESIDEESEKSSQPVCGKRQVSHSELIANGEESKSGDWPFHASIFHTSIRTFQYKCGGIVISNTLILTAAHCVLENGNEMIPERIKVHVGRNNLKNFDRNSQEFGVFSINCHENFNRDNVRHDISVLKLGTSITFTRFIQPACLPTDNFVIEDQVGMVIGFGRTEKGQLSPILREARMKVPSKMDCLGSNRDFYGLFLYDGNYCAGQLREKKAACAGDSGGGMYFKVNDVWVVRGIVSVGMKSDKEEECSPDNYVLYTDIYKHMTWLKEKMK